MTEILAVFRSRSQAVDCNARLRAHKVPVTLINTPREAGVGCGLSLKIPPAALNNARSIIAGGKYPSFYGFYAMRNDFGRITVSRLNR